MLVRAKEPFIHGRLNEVISPMDIYDDDAPVVRDNPRMFVEVTGVEVATAEPGAKRSRASSRS